MAAPLRAAVVVLAVALTAVAAQFTTTVPFTAVPLTFTPVAVLLIGAALGSRLGALSQLLYVGLGALGFSVFAPSVTLPPGLLRLVGPTGGYLMAYPLAAFVTGRLAEQGWDRQYLGSLLSMVVGLIVIYLGGASWLALAYTHSFTAALSAGVMPFLLLDLLKLTATAMILPKVWQVVGPRID